MPLTDPGGGQGPSSNFGRAAVPRVRAYAVGLQGARQRHSTGRQSKPKAVGGGGAEGSVQARDRKLCGVVSSLSLSSRCYGLAAEKAIVDGMFKVTYTSETPGSSP